MSLECASLAGTTDLQPRISRVKLGVIAFVIAYVVVLTALRSQFEPRYNDTDMIGMYLNGTMNDPADREHIGAKMCTSQYWKNIWLSSEHAAKENGYIRPHAFRPLQTLYTHLDVILYFRVGAWLPFLIGFALVGLSGYLVFLSLAEIGGLGVAAVCAAAYLLFPAVVLPAWNPLAGPQSLIPGAYAGVTVAYLRYLRTGRLGYLLAMAGVFLIGPWLKETIGLAALLVLTHHVFVAQRKRWWLVGALSLAFLHGLYPETLLRLVLTGNVYVVSIFQCGSLHDHATASTWRPAFPIDLAAQLPPSVLLLALSSVVACSYGRRPVVQLTLPLALDRYAVWLARGALWLAAPGATAFLLSAIMGQPLVGRAVAASTAFAALALYGLLYVDALVAAWFCCIFLPLLRIYFNTTQCGYLAPPLVCLVIVPIVHAWGMLAAWQPGRARSTLRYAVGLVCLVGFADNALSVPNAWLAYRNTGKLNDDIFTEDLLTSLRQPDAKRHWTLIENSMVADDALTLASRFEMCRGRYNFNNGVPPQCVLNSEAALKRTLADYNCILVVADYANSFQHRYWDIHGIEKYFRPVGEQQVEFSGYYADPLRRAIDNRFRSMMGPPDYQHEFEKTTCWFREEFTNRYRVFVRQHGLEHVVGLSKLFAAETTPQLVEAGWQGFNLIACAGAYFALPPAAGAFDLKKARNHGYAVCYEAASIDELKRRVQEAPAQPEHDQVPRLVLADWHGFNVIACDGAFFALPQGSGAFDLQKAREHGYATCYEAESIDDLKRLVDAHRARSASKSAAEAAADLR